MASCNPVPLLSDEQRRANLERAVAARRERADVRRRVASGELPFADALSDPGAQGMRVSTLIRAVRGMGPAKTERVMLSCGIAACKRVKGLGPLQREALLRFMGAGR